MDLQLIPARLAVARLEPTSDVPDWAEGPGFVSITRTSEELSIACDEARVPETETAERGWCVLKVPGPIPFEEVGVLESVARPLALAGVSIFAISTYDTDYVLVRERDLDAAIAALVGAGHTVSN